MGEGEGGVEERFLEIVTRVKIERKKIKEATKAGEALSEFRSSCLQQLAGR